MQTALQLVTFRGGSNHFNTVLPDHLSGYYIIITKLFHLTIIWTTFPCISSLSVSVTFRFPSEAISSLSDIVCFPSIKVKSLQKRKELFKWDLRLYIWKCKWFIVTEGFKIGPVNNLSQSLQWLQSFEASQTVEVTSNRKCFFYHSQRLLLSVPDNIKGHHLCSKTLFCFLWGGKVSLEDKSCFEILQTWVVEERWWWTHE